MAKPGPKPMEPTKDERAQVAQMASVGITHEQIALCVRDGISADTLVKYFGAELKTARIKANAKIGGKLYNEAMNGNVTAMIWWTKSQMGWRETSTHEHTGANGSQLFPVWIEPK